MNEKTKVQGEGDYEAARRYRERSEEFVANNDVEEVAEQAAPATKAEAEDLKAAEAAGQARAKGEDPALKRRRAPQAEPATGGQKSKH